MPIADDDLSNFIRLHRKRSASPADTPGKRATAASSGRYEAMRLWSLAERLILELDSVDLELVIIIEPDGVAAAAWLWSQTGAIVATVPVLRV